MTDWRSNREILQSIEGKADRLLAFARKGLASDQAQEDMIMGLREDMDVQLQNAEEEMVQTQGIQASVLILMATLDELAKQKADALVVGDVERVKAIEASLEAHRTTLAAAVERYTPPTPSGA